LKKLFFIILLIFGFCINAEKFSDYLEVSEPEYTLIYEANGFFTMDKESGTYTKVSSGKYKFTDNDRIIYLTVKDDLFNGTVYIYDKEDKKLLSEENYTAGRANGKWIEYDNNEKPKQIDYLKDDYIVKRQIFVNGKLIVTKNFKEGLYRLP
jgi:antitoxin component YwqK of YwqJK toxin-antitoxin module